MSDNKENHICASACFLAYAGGVNRFGTYLALHRPFFSKDDAAKISDLEYETVEKQEMHKIEEYLRSMEIDQFFIDKMMANSSQDAYIVTVSDALHYHLTTKYVPSIEEILLAKCTTITSQEVGTLNAMTEPSRGMTQDTEQLRSLLVEKLVSSDECEDNVLQDIRKKAFERAVEDVVKTKCKVPHKCTNEETADFISKSWKAEADDVIRIALQQNAKMEGGEIVSASQLYPMVGKRDGITTYGFEELRPMLLEKSDLPVGKSVPQIWRLLGDQGNRFAQYNLGLLYAHGEGVPQDYAEAAKWIHMAADQGDHNAQCFLAVEYETGKGVPQNYVQAYIWYSRAIAYRPPEEGSADRQAYDGVVGLREKLAALMTPAQIDEAERMAREWKPPVQSGP